MIVFPNCKINLGLHIVSKRSDGYHNIETVFYPVNLCDALEILPTVAEFSFTTSGLKIDGNPNDNLCVKAYTLLKNDFSQIGNIQMHLHKIIPSGAGLGGGSADAAFTIKLLNDIYELNLNYVQMQGYCKKLGSDCSFFIENKPIYATEKGDIFEPTAIDLSNYKIVIIKPSFGISTVEAYTGIQPTEPSVSIKNILQKPVSCWKSFLVNDFENSLFLRYPVLSEIKQELYRQGAVYASMSGSGSALYGIFDKVQPIESKNIFTDCFLWESE